jgi:predicted O-methyltransferase YrrM
LKFEHIFAQVGTIPFISERNAQYLYDLVLKEKRSNILELGIAHGTATCIIAAALDELGHGKVTSVDLTDTRYTYHPSAEDQVLDLGLSKYVEIVRMKSGYNWFLHDEIARNSGGGNCDTAFDLCIVDGPKNWTIDSSAFFLVDKLLDRDGKIIFDDYNWTYDSADQIRDTTDGITHRHLSQEERVSSHVKEIFELLVKQHPNYGLFENIDDGDWVIATKTRCDPKIYTLVYRETTADIGAKIFRKLNSKIQKLWS